MDNLNTARGARLAALPPLTEGPFSAHTKLPTEHGEFDVRILLDEDGREHLAFSVGDLDGAEDVPVRVHSECMTSEVFGSLKCDCKHQLDAALAHIQREGRGVVCYLRQEGRGIGLTNKVRAYALQNAGADTVDANRLLGLPDDTREYSAAAQMIHALGVASVRVMTNNPLKLEGLRQHGVTVNGRIQHVMGVNHVNHGYLEAKRARMGHLYQTIDLLAAKAS